MRRLGPWALFALGGLLGLLAMGWISRVALRAERAETLGRQRAAQEEKVRLALWRMDSALAPLVAQENARPYFHFRPYFPAERAYTRMFARLRPGEVMVPSPLLHSNLPLIRLHFQMAPSGHFSSPQVPGPEARDRGPQVEAATRRLAEVQALLPRETSPSPFAMTPPPRLAMASRAQGTPGQVVPSTAGRAAGEVGEAPAPAAARAALKQEVALNQVDQQAALNLGEYQARANQQVMNNAMASQAQGLAQAAESPLGARTRTQQSAPAPPGGASQAKPHPGAQAAREPKPGPTPSARPLAPTRTAPKFMSSPEPVGEGAMTPLWAQGNLFLIRHVQVEGREYLQGCWLDWPVLQAWLLRTAADLLPSAQLLPVEIAAPDQDRRLAALPLRLVPGPIPEDGPPGDPTVRTALLFGWGCALLAAVAVALVLHQALPLSERRGAFVSAVTHELRTPLTTFRMYAELLWREMVPDPAERHSLLGTLVTEADRLDHLVKNVLSYARLESGRARADMEALSLGQLLDRCHERLAQRTEQADLTLVVELTGELSALEVRTDPSLVEQILFNLVDNACKYAAAGPLKVLRLQVSNGPGVLRLALRDHGPGMTQKEARQLFRPFSKSAHQAARTAPGVGLGLALSRRLARGLGGSLRLDPDIHDGARFVLSLPA